MTLTYEPQSVEGLKGLRSCNGTPPTTPALWARR